MKKLSILIGILFLQNVLAQEEECSLEKSEFNIYKVNAEDLRCLAKNTDKRNTIFLRLPAGASLASIIFQTSRK